MRQRFAARELRITQRPFGSRIRDFRVRSGQSFGRDIPFLGRYTDKQIARRFRHAAELRRHRRRRTAAKRARIKRRQSRIRQHQAYALERHSQFVSDGLRNGSSNVLSHFSLAGESGHYAVFSNVQPRGDFPATYLIQTPSSGQGILQILALPHQAVKLRYKMLDAVAAIALFLQQKLLEPIKTN